MELITQSLPEIPNWKPTKSQLFLYPFLQLNPFYDGYVFNTYLFSECFPELLDPYIQVVFRFNGRLGENSWLMLEEKLKLHPCYLASQDIKKGSHVLFLFETPKLHKPDFNLFLEGKYSAYSSLSKEIIINKNNKVDYLSAESRKQITQIFNRSEELRQLWSNKIGQQIEPGKEVYGIYEKNDETFNLDKLAVKY